MDRDKHEWGETFSATDETLLLSIFEA